MLDLIEMFKDETEFVSIPADQAIVRVGESGTAMYVIVDGTADVLVGAAIVETVGRGGLVGEMTLVDNVERSASVIARTDCRLIPISVERFDILIQQKPSFARHVMTVIAERLRKMNERLIRNQSVDRGDRGY